jgi:hypothetical protein
VKQTLLVLTLAVISGFAQTRQAPVATITLYTQFQIEAPKSVTDGVRNELKSIMDPVGLHFDWRRLSPATSNEVSVELAVLTFKGRCDADNLISARGNPGALGWTHISDGVILPFSDIDCDRMRTFLQRDLLSFPAEQRNEKFGRAMARVVAHELYHILANTTKHGSCGVGRASYSVNELLGGVFQFERKESEALRATRVATTPEIAAGPMP